MLYDEQESRRKGSQLKTAFRTKEKDDTDTQLIHLDSQTQPCCFLLLLLWHGVHEQRLCKGGRIAFALHIRL
jgi:hypothetical protein